MTLNDILEGNKLIAEIMGAKKRHSTKEGDIYSFPDKIPSYITKELKYHCSWDWLMPALKGFLVILKNADFKDRSTKEWANAKRGIIERAIWDYAYLDLTITDVFAKFIEVIIWYNEQLNTKNSNQ